MAAWMVFNNIPAIVGMANYKNLNDNIKRQHMLSGFGENFMVSIFIISRAKLTLGQFTVYAAFTDCPISIGIHTCNT